MQTTLLLRRRLLCALVLALIAVVGGAAARPLPQNALAQAPPFGARTLPVDAMPNIKTDFGAVGDGFTDDTAAIQRALDEGRGQDIDYYGRPKALFFPPGVYLVSNTLVWRGCCVTLQGAGSGATVIKLRDNAPAFGNPSSPKPVIKTPEGNMSFRQNVWDLTVHTGSNNPGAIGIDWIASNSGAVRDVVIRSGDGQGQVGLDMSRPWPGPCLIKNLRVEGFDYGILVGHGEYGPTFEGITLSGQRVAGIGNSGNILAIRRLESDNRVPAIKSSIDSSAIIVLDGSLRGGDGATSAIEAEGYVYLRNVVSDGYRSALAHRGSVVPGATQSEYTSAAAKRLFDSPPLSLNLPISETPTVADGDPASWGRFEPTYYGDTRDLQELLNSGKSTIYFPFGGYFSYDERAVTVPPTVRRIIGFSSVVNGDGKGLNGGGIKFVVSAPSDEPLVIEQFGYGVKIEQRGPRAVAIKHGNYTYTSAPGAGDLYLEDAEIGDFRMQPGQRVWARQFNNESAGPKIVNNGGTLWILGLKTEVPGTVIETVGGGKSELLGTLIYPSRPFTDAQLQEPAFTSSDSQMSLIYATSVYCERCGYALQVAETRGGETRTLPSAAMEGRTLFYTGYPATPTSQNAPPLVTLTSPAAGTTAAGPPLLLRATGSDPDGNIVLVEFFAGDTKVGADSVAPYCFSWRDAPPGQYTLTARATDNGGATASSSPVSIQLTAPITSAYRLLLPIIHTPPGGTYQADGC